MTIDKIKALVGEHIYQHWQNETNVEQMKKAEKELRKELECGILPNDSKYYAELELLCKRIGKVYNVPNYNSVKL